MIALDDLANGVELGVLTDGDVAAMLTRLAAAQARIAAYLIDRRSPQAADRLLDASETAAILGVSKTYLYRRSKRLPFIVRFDGKLRYSARGIERFIASRLT